ncbi:MAG: UDP-3-O-acyl-N-acetylglucosamine deacetylase [Desulfuromonadales bacterium]|nr:UDP-3-O-acyl-N-acetylglucosamine deacetylase [Desulfuromonadales bacterium]
MIFQSTVAKPLTISGIGLHTGEQISMNLRPAEADTGVIFYRQDGDRRVAIEARSANVIDTRMATVLGKAGLSVSTVEHFMAALYSLEIDNLHVDIDGPEVPIMDGSAEPFLKALRSVGIRTLTKSRAYLAIRKPLSFIDGEKRINIIPSRFFRITSDIAFDHPSIALQHRSIKHSTELFSKEIAPARTFGFLEEVEFLKANGLARGGSLENAIVIDKKGVMNPDGLRFNDEFVRHKILDTIGDFSLIGYPVLGHIRTYKSGHDINHLMVEKILASPDHWQLVEFNDEELRHAARVESSEGLHGLLAYNKA